MKKAYTPPTVSKVEMDSDIIRMLTKRGFNELLSERLQEARKDVPSLTEEDVFNGLNEKYLKTIGCDRYSSYLVYKSKNDFEASRMHDKMGFVNKFWDLLAETRKENPRITQEAVFNALNEKYYKETGCFRYSCFDSFRIVRDKK